MVHLKLADANMYYMSLDPTTNCGGALSCLGDGATYLRSNCTSSLDIAGIGGDLYICPLTGTLPLVGLGSAVPVVVIGATLSDTLELASACPKGKT